MFIDNFSPDFKVTRVVDEVLSFVNSMLLEEPLACAESRLVTLKIETDNIKHKSIFLNIFTTPSFVLIKIQILGYIIFFYKTMTVLKFMNFIILVAVSAIIFFIFKCFVLRNFFVIESLNCGGEWDDD